MEKIKKYIFASLITAVLLVSSLTAISFSDITGSVSAAVSEDLMQYEWPSGAYDGARSRFSPGPAPNAPDLTWGPPTSRSGDVYGIDGKIFTISAGTSGGVGTLYCYDPITLENIYTVELPTLNVPVGVSPTVFVSNRGGDLDKVGDDFLVIDRRYDVNCIRISNGQVVWSLSEILPTFELTGAGSSMYWQGLYDEKLKIRYQTTNSIDGKKNELIAFDYTDPSKLPVLMWRKTMDEPVELMCAGDEKVYLSTNSWSVMAFDAHTGERVWRTQTTQNSWFCGAYYEGKVINTGGKYIHCLDADTGEMLWKYNLGTLGYIAEGGAVAYDRFYCQYVNYNGISYACFDINTGDLIWEDASDTYVAAREAYLAPRVADGKVYVDNQWRGGELATGLACYNAYDGTLLWQLPGISPGDGGAIAYGAYWGISNGRLFRIGPTNDWSMWRGNLDNPGVAQAGPENLNLLWKFTTDGPVTSSPAVVQGKVYVGSHDYNIYCIDAYTGQMDWEFETEYRVMSSPAVVGGKLFTGADDGFVYCLNAATGQMEWKTDAGGWRAINFASNFQPRSSPLVSDNRLWVGALDENIYCINTLNGVVLWKYKTGGPIGGSPVLYEGNIYISSTDGYLYALDAMSGDLVWKSEIIPQNLTPNGESILRWAPLRNIATPTFGGGLLYFGTGIDFPSSTSEWDFFALDPATGDIVWNYTRIGAVYAVFTPTYHDGVLYLQEGQGLCSAVYAENGTLKWLGYAGHVRYSSIAYADDPRGDKVYFGSGIYSVFCFDAETGQKLSWFETDGAVESSPSIWDGKLYVGSADWNVYCLGDNL